MAKSFGEAMRDIGRNISRDIGMGVSGGLGSNERQASNLSRAGYSDAEIKDFQDRTAATQERNRQEAAERGGNRGDNSAVSASISDPAALARVLKKITGGMQGEAVTPTPPGAPLPVVPGDMTSTGSAEDTALGSARQGLASTIATGAQGLLAESAGQLRRRRSLLGGGLIA